MDKILIAVDSQNMDESSVSFAFQLAKFTHSRLTGIFLEEPDLEEEIIITRSGQELYGESVAIKDSREDEDKVSVRLENMDRFRTLSEQHMVQVSIHLDKGLPVNDLIAESRCSDLLIINATTSFFDLDENAPTGFVKTVLHDAGCPVIISPETFEGIDDIIFCYDGSKSAVFAMKQFTYLFPELKSNRVKIIYLNDKEDLIDEEELRVTDWLRYHYNNDVEWIIPNEEAKVTLFEYLAKKGKDFVVMGAYGKGLLSSFFKSSEEENGLRIATLPIFVSHF
jgi:nucleotide-binding universal stress UspA family protein